MKLARREKYFVTFAACFLAVLLSWQFVLVPFVEKKARFQRGITVRVQELQEIRRLIAEYQSIKQDTQALEAILKRRQKDFSLFAFLENAAGASGVKGFIKYMKPSVMEKDGFMKQSLVEIKLQGITLPLLVAYLQRIESPEDLVVIKRISIQEQKKEGGYLDAVLLVMTYS